MGEFIIIFQMIMEAIIECRKDRDRDEIEAGLNNPGIGEWWVARRTIKKKMKLRGRALKRKTERAIAELRATDPEDVAAFMDEVEARIEAKEQE